jgi:alpha-tubulin suppressor-like RCC1 family protein
LTTDNKLYSWGRGLYGVLGNGSNDYSLIPKLNDLVEGIKEESEPHSSILKIDSADEFSVMMMSDGSLNSWGKND